MNKLMKINKIYTYSTWVFETCRMNLILHNGGLNSIIIYEQSYHTVRDFPGILPTDFSVFIIDET